MKFISDRVNRFAMQDPKIVLQ